MSLLGIRFVAPNPPAQESLASKDDSSRADKLDNHKHHSHRVHHHKSSRHRDSGVRSSHDPWINESLERRLDPGISSEAKLTLDDAAGPSKGGPPQERMDWMGDSNTEIEHVGTARDRKSFLSVKPAGAGIVADDSRSVEVAPQLFVSSSSSWRERAKGRVELSSSSLETSDTLLSGSGAGRVSWKLPVPPGAPSILMPEVKDLQAPFIAASRTIAHVEPQPEPRLCAPSCDSIAQSDSLAAVNAAKNSSAPSTAVFTEGVKSSGGAAGVAADLNRLHSAALRAQLAGNTEKHASLLEQIAALTPPGPFPTTVIGGGAALPEAISGQKRPRVPESTSRSQAEATPAAPATVLLSTLDSKGRPISSLQAGPASLEREDARLGRRQGKRTSHVNLHAPDAPTERTSWTPADARESSVSLAELVRREAHTSSGTLDANIARRISRAGASWKHDKTLQGSRAGADEDDDGVLDDIARLAEDPDARLTPHAQQQKDKQRAMAAQRRHDHATASCSLCFDSPASKRHLIISLGEYSYLGLPPGGGRLPGQLRIVPLPHISALTEADEEVYEEVNRFKGALHALYSSQGREVVFLETALNLSSSRHAIIDVIPMDKAEGEDAPLFFRKAIVDAEEWTTNKKLIDTAGRGLRKCIPKQFPYFHVAWKGGGFVHPVEDTETFPPNFGIDTAAGILGLPPSGFGRKEKRPQFETERIAILAFLKDWGPFDWTQKLDGGRAAGQ